MLFFAPHVQALSLASTNISVMLSSWVSSLVAHHEFKCRAGEIRQCKSLSSCIVAEELRVGDGLVFLRQVFCSVVVGQLSLVSMSSAHSWCAAESQTLVVGHKQSEA